MAPNSDEIMTIEELSEYLKISKSTLYKLSQEGALPGAKVGKHWRFHKGVVDQWLGKTGENSLPPSKQRGSK